MEVLDFGCGNGARAHTIAQSVRSIGGLEINDYPRSFAEIKIQKYIVVVRIYLSSERN